MHQTEARTIVSKLEIGQQFLLAGVAYEIAEIEENLYSELVIRFFLRNGNPTVTHTLIMPRNYPFDILLNKE